MSSRTINVTGEEVFPQNKLRKSFVIQNEDTTINCFVKREKPGTTDVSTTDHDHRLARETSIALNVENDGKEETQGRWTIVAASGTPRISFFETEDIRR